MRILSSLFFGACLVLAAVTSAAGQETNSTENAASRNNSTLGYTAKSAPEDSAKTTERHALAPTDEKFLMDASMINNAEVAMGRLVLERSANSNVKSFAETVIKSHTEANKELTEIADRLGITLTTALAPNHQAVIAGMQNLSGDDFDRAYVKQQLGDHAATIDLYKAAGKSKERDLKFYAKDRLSSIEAHYATLKSLDNRLTPSMLVVVAPSP